MAIVAILFVTAGEILYKPTAAAQVLDAAPEHLVGQYRACTPVPAPVALSSPDRSVPPSTQQPRPCSGRSTPP